MATTSIFDQAPPFPGNIPVVSLPLLSHAKLIAGDAAETTALLKASIEHGFFLLDLTETAEGRSLLSDVGKAFEIGKSFFALDLEEKKKYKVNSSNVGYKPMGVMSFADGKRDLTEICAVGKDSIIDPSVAPIPTVFSDNRAFMTSMVHRLHPIAMLLLEHLAAKLSIPFETLAAFHEPSKPSASVLRFIHNPPQSSLENRQASLLGHTDSGSITILFAALGGLQILPADMPEEPSNWLWVRPEPGCAIVNLGDPLVQWTGGILRSSFHRVLYAPGAQSSCERYSFGYFLKPADEASMTQIEGGLVSRGEEIEDVMPCYDDWHRNKTKGIMEGLNNVKTRGGNMDILRFLTEEITV